MIISCCCLQMTPQYRSSSTGASPLARTQQQSGSPLSPAVAASSLSLPCFLPIPESQPVLPALLRRLLQQGAVREALALAARHEGGPHFRRSLEWLLFTTLDLEAPKCKLGGSRLSTGGRTHHNVARPGGANPAGAAELAAYTGVLGRQGKVRDVPLLVLHTIRLLIKTHSLLQIV